MDVENFGWSVVKNFAEHRFSEVGLVSGAINFVESKLPHEKINVAEIAKSFASQLKDLAQEKIANQTAPDDAKSELSAIIELSETALEKQLPNDMLDYHTYLLFLALHGSKGDIGAEYAGFTFAGFENRVK